MLTAESADYLRHNAVTVNLFHPMLEYDLIEEKVAYTAIDIIGKFTCSILYITNLVSYSTVFYRVYI